MKKKRYTEVQYVEAKRLHADEHLSYREIARRLGVSDHKVVGDWVSGKRKPYAVKPLADYPHAFRPKKGFEALGTAKGYLLGCLCGDASLWRLWTARYVGLCVTDRDFAEAFAKALLDAYGATVRVAERKKAACAQGVIYVVQLGSGLVCDDLDRRMEGRYKTEDWDVPLCVRDAVPEVRQAFLRGFFDSEGGWTGTQQIMAWSRNSAGSESIVRLLASLGISAKRYVCVKRDRPYYAVAISGRSRDKFLAEVGFSIRRKQHPEAS